MFQEAGEKDLKKPQKTPKPQINQSKPNRLTQSDFVPALGLRWSLPKAYNISKVYRNSGKRCLSVFAPGKRDPLGCQGLGHLLFGCLCLQAGRRNPTLQVLWKCY